MRENRTMRTHCSRILLYAFFNDDYGSLKLLYGIHYAYETLCEIVRVCALFFWALIHFGGQKNGCETQSTRYI